jgi:hypothetical protein
MLTASLMAFILASSQFAIADLLSDAKNMMSDDALLSGLTSSLDLDAEQAGGGIGSILSLAENKLPAADYESLVGSIPGADKYIKMAKDAGVLTDPITDVGRLNSAMEKLGISQEASSALFSKLGDFVGTAGGSDIKSSLMGLLN